jgi:hypothetical protein
MAQLLRQGRSQLGEPTFVRREYASVVGDGLVNVVVFVGTVAADPVQRRMPSGDKVGHRVGATLASCDWYSGSLGQLPL